MRSEESSPHRLAKKGFAFFWLLSQKWHYMQIFGMHSDGLAHLNFFKLRNFQLISKHIFSPALVLARCKSTAGCIVEVQCPSCHFFGNKDSGGGDALILKPFLPLLLLQLLLLLLIIFISILLLLPFSFSINNSSFFSPPPPSSIGVTRSSKAAPSQRRSRQRRQGI